MLYTDIRPHRLVGLVVKVSALRAAHPGLILVFGMDLVVVAAAAAAAVVVVVIIIMIIIMILIIIAFKGAIRDF